MADVDWRWGGWLVTVMTRPPRIGVATTTPTSWLRFVGRRLGHLFPYVPGQSGYNRRLCTAAPALALVLEHLAQPCRRGGSGAAAGRHPGALLRLGRDRQAQ
jgi:hypothetical protein